MTLRDSVCIRSITELHVSEVLPYEQGSVDESTGNDCAKSAGINKFNLEYSLGGSSADCRCIQSEVVKPSILKVVCVKCEVIWVCGDPKPRRE